MHDEPRRSGRRDDNGRPDDHSRQPDDRRPDDRWSDDPEATRPYEVPPDYEGRYSQGYGQEGAPQTRPYGPDQGGYYSDQPPDYGNGDYRNGDYRNGGPADYGDYRNDDYRNGNDDNGNGRSGHGRTIALLVLLVVLVAVIGLLFGFYVTRDKKSSSPTTPAVTPTTSAVTTTRALPTTETSATPTPTTTAPAPVAGEVVYALTGDGSVLGLTYPTSSGTKVIPEVTRAPWQATESGVDNPTLRGVVVRGSVTCTITRDGNVVHRTTSGIGPLNCA
ncbi:hypothetical protein GCM10027169_01820 [Gordonia jinhuaensis]|uniref:Uncharacterized protein n=1 Tax=Gordonia jinhuaensis TaxID=1517702 RepID=A0A916WTE6_9ACTN|nr:hypothetical protein [Gordonia jinhuaensis]GGB28087.1 hypothetical protein GCM10011489_15350 [Gordonia jinhuaensis]